MKGYIQVVGRSIYLPSLSELKPKPKYRFSRNWYQADFHWTDYDEIIDWCEQQFGSQPVRHDAWSRWWQNGQDRVFFRDAKDYNWYVLRWGA